MNNQEQFKNQWNQFRSVIQENFDALTPDDISQINGKRDVLVSKIQARYGISKDVAEEQLSEIEATSLNTGSATRGVKDTGSTGASRGKVPGAGTTPRTGSTGTPSSSTGKTGTTFGKQGPKDQKSSGRTER